MATMSRTAAAVSQQIISLFEDDFGIAALLDGCSTARDGAATVRASTEPQSGHLRASACTFALQASQVTVRPALGPGSQAGTGLAGNLETRGGREAVCLEAFRFFAAERAATGFKRTAEPQDGQRVLYPSGPFLNLSTNPHRHRPRRAMEASSKRISRTGRGPPFQEASNPRG